MIKKIIFVLINLLVAVNLACSNAAAPNTETNKAVVISANSANLPEGLSANQVPLTTNSTPGIPDPKSADANINYKNAASIPGIPDTTRTGKTPQPKNTPPIPGIPDEETLKKQMTTPVDKSVMDKKPSEADSNSAGRAPAKPRTTRKP
jgi:ABC-type Na+ efflux pump permease subunit